MRALWMERRGGSVAPGDVKRGDATPPPQARLSLGVRVYHWIAYRDGDTSVEVD